MQEKLCITVKLYHYNSKFGPEEIYQAIYLKPMELKIESYFGEEGEFGK